MPKNLRRRGATWWFRICRKGKEHEGSLETDNIAIARGRLEEVRRRITDRAWGMERHTFDDAACKFGESHFPRLKPKARIRYVASIANLERTLKGVHLDSITNSILSEFETMRVAEGVASATVRRDLACLSSIFTRCEEWEWLKANPVKAYLRSRKDALPESQPREAYWTPQQEEAALLVMPPKTRLMAIFAIDTGLRREEQMSLLWSDVDLDARQITVRKEVSKSKRSRKVPILPRTLDLLMAMPKDLGHVFKTVDGNRYSPHSPSLNDNLAKGCRRAGLERIRWHDLRRTCGCRLLQEHGLSMEEVSIWLGHSSVKVTEKHYAFLNVEHLHRALERGSVVVPFKRRTGQN